MKYYTIAEFDITDRAWVRDYVQNVTKMVERYGGKYLARTANIKRFEGERQNPQIFLLVEWPSQEAAETFYNSEEYQPYLQVRLAGSKSEMVLIAGEDMTS